MEYEQLIGSVEAILFASGDPVPVTRICDVLGMGRQDAELLIASLQDRLVQSGSALEVVRLEDAYQLTTKAEYIAPIRSALELKKNIPLSQAALEVLAVVAYHQPVTKSYVEQVRGVDCSGVISSLLTKGLLEERGRLDLPGRPLLYGTTDTFLRCFQLETIADLPPIPQDEKEASNVQMEINHLINPEQTET